MKSEIETPAPVTRSEAMREENPQKTSGLPALSGNEQEQRAPVTKLVIDRSRWLRGEGSDDSMLLRARDGKLCCLGFFGCALGIEQSAILNVSDPQEAARRELWPDWLFDPLSRYGRSGACSALIVANDSTELRSFAREEQIARLFAEHGVEVTFVDAAGPEISGSPEAKKGPDHP